MAASHPLQCAIARKAGDDSKERSRDAMRPKFCWKPSPMKIKGRREDRMRAAPAVSQAVCIKICCPRAYRFSGEHPASPTQWLYGLYDFVLVTGLIATIALGRLSPSLNLTPAPGRRTQTTSPYARTRLRRKAMPGATALVFRGLASIAPCPTFATMANAPLDGTGWREF